MRCDRVEKKHEGIGGNVRIVKGERVRKECEGDRRVGGSVRSVKCVGWGWGKDLRGGWEEGARSVSGEW